MQWFASTRPVLAPTPKRASWSSTRSTSKFQSGESSGRASAKKGSELRLAALGFFATATPNVKRSYETEFPSHPSLQPHLGRPWRAFF
jgi:hypothetical protein